MMDDEIIEIEIKVMAEIRYKEESSWGSFGCVPASTDDYHRVSFNKYGNMSVSGVVHRLDIGAVYKLRAKITQSKDWGTQYQILKIAQDIPTTPEQVKEYVRNFVTPLQFEAIYEVYDGIDVIDLMKNDNFEYAKVRGFGLFTYEKIKEKLLKNLELQELINEFPELDYKILNKLLKEFPSSAILKEKLKENPYILTDVAGIGFKTADKIALEMGIDTLSPFRIHSALRYVVREVERNGDTYIKEAKLISGSYELLKVRKVIIKAELESVDELMKVDTRYCFKKTFQQEAEVAQKLMEMKNNSTELDFDVEEFIAEQEDKYKIKLTDQQKQFFYNFKLENVTLLVGYAGCGKSMLQKLLINLLEEKLHLSYILLSPTGKASKVLSKYTGRKAWTIHKATGIGKGSEDFNDVKVYEDVIIIDESSMCGVDLAHTLLYKIENPNARIIFAGDSFQLPSVSRGNLLYDLQESEVFPTAKLDIVFRQGEGGILDLVTKVRLGQKFIDNKFKGVKKFGDNCILVACPQEKMEAGYKYYYNEFQKKYGVSGVMVLSPTKKGKLGTHAINRTIQQIANPITDEENQIKQIKDGEEMFFRVNDIVINTVNSYKMMTTDEREIDIMNGETGIITEIDVKNRSMIINYDGELVITSSADIEKILHSHCITKHKSQGSASKSVLSITDRSHTYQLNANLIYTAWTRAEEYLGILCQPEVLNRALEQIENLRRNTFLCEILDRRLTA